MSSSERLPAQRVTILPQEPAPKAAATQVRRTPLAKGVIVPDLLADRMPQNTLDEAVAQVTLPPSRVFDRPGVQAAASAWRPGEIENAAVDAVPDGGERKEEESGAADTVLADPAAALQAPQARLPGPLGELQSSTPLAGNESLGAPAARRAAGADEEAGRQVPPQLSPQVRPVLFEVPFVALQRTENGARNLDGLGVPAPDKTRPERTDRVRRPARSDLGNCIENDNARDDVQAASELLHAIVARAPALDAREPQDRLVRLVEELSAGLQISTQTQADRWDIRLLLKNEILPKTALHMSSDGYCMTTRFTTTDAGIDRMLRSNSAMLEDALRRRCRLRIIVEVERVDRLR